MTCARRGPVILDDLVPDVLVALSASVFPGRCRIGYGTGMSGRLVPGLVQTLR